MVLVYLRLFCYLFPLFILIWLVLQDSHNSDACYQTTIYVQNETAINTTGWTNYALYKTRFEVVMGSGQIFFDPGWVSHLWFGKFPLNIPNFSIFCPSDQKNVTRLGQKVLWSKPDQKYARVGSGQGPSLV